MASYSAKEQQLSSGIIISQNVFVSTRMVIFNTNNTDTPIATQGGTALIIQYGNKYLALTAAHTIRDGFNTSDLWLPCRHTYDATHFLKPKRSFALNEGDAILGDLSDIIFIELEPEHSEIDCYVWDSRSVSDASKNDQVTVIGYLKASSNISYDVKLGAVHVGALAVTQPAVIQGYVDPMPDTDETLIRARSQVKSEEQVSFEQRIGDAKGLSGAPVYNDERNALCGIVTRAGYNKDSGFFSFHFVSASLIDEALTRLYMA